MNPEKTYSTENPPFITDLEQFAPPYKPEKFTREELRYLRPFFSNVNKPVFIAHRLPEEVIGALSSRYSRSTDSLRRLFLREYIGPIVHPEDNKKEWEGLNAREKKQRYVLRDSFLEYIDYLNGKGGIDNVVNIQRGRAFFEKWLALYGDDSIAEMGGAHVCFEGISNIVTKEIQDKRIGVSPLEKSTRYVSFSDRRSDGEYLFTVPAELEGTSLEAEFKAAMNGLFETYARLEEPYRQYIMEKYPQGEDETPASFRNSRSAKRYDDLRDLLPFATQTNFATYGNGRSYEGIITRLLSSTIGEAQWWGKELCKELATEVPSFVHRPQTERGAQAQLYRRNIHILRNQMVEELVDDIPSSEAKQGKWAKLIDHTPDPDIAILSSFLMNAEHGRSLTQLTALVRKAGKKKRKEMLEAIFKERQFGRTEPDRVVDRFRTVPRAFENALFRFAIVGRGGDFRDLHRHRMLTQERHLFTTRFGYDLDSDVLTSPFAAEIKKALESAAAVSGKIAKKLSPEVAQYAVPFAYLQQWYMTMTAREIFWIAELRTSPQGRPHYREICTQIVDEALKAAPTVFSGVMVDRADYRLSRRESEKKIEAKIKKLGVD